MTRRRVWSRPARPRRRADQRGAVGGVEVLPFGLLVFVVGALLIAHAWAVIDAKLAVEAAAREAGRAYVESDDEGAARAAALRSARDAMAGVGRDPDRLSLARSATAFVRCAEVEHTATYRIPAVSLPFVGGVGSTTVTGRHRDVIDPYRAGLGTVDDCG